MALRPLPPMTLLTTKLLLKYRLEGKRAEGVQIITEFIGGKWRALMRQGGHIFAASAKFDSPDEALNSLVPEEAVVGRVAAAERPADGRRGYKKGGA